MKILYIETSLTGHHQIYLESLLSSCKIDECYAIVPHNEKKVVNIMDNHLFYVDYGTCSYWQWLCKVRKIAESVQPNIIHFLNGDTFYRYFGLGLNHCCPKAKIIVTCHHLYWDWKHKLSYKVMSKVIDSFVVHTNKLKVSLQNSNVKNVFHVEYPQFTNSHNISQDEALKRLKINTHGKNVLLALGGTRYDKGLDILLDALNHVYSPFFLIIAGVEQSFKRDFIEEKIRNYRDNVVLFLTFLSDEKFALCLNAANIIVLPYRKIFDGASGPLGEGVWHFKEIIGPSHGSLGDLIIQNHLGRVFATENITDLADKIEESLQEKWEPDNIYRKYRESLDPSSFQKKYQRIYSTLLENKK